MGVLNVTPDSFSDGGSYCLLDSAVNKANEMIAEGANIIDIGGESTRPKAVPVSIEEELLRVIPIIKAIRSTSNIAISIDTSKPDVMREAVEAGVTIINDVYALRRPGALDMAASLDVPVCLVHMQSIPENMQDVPSYSNIIDEVNEFFVQRVSACREVGIKKENIILDPGFGFGKTLQHNLKLLADLASFKVHGLPVLVGISRKSMIGDLLDKPANERMTGSVAAALMAVNNGASIVRVHDVEQTSDALKIYNAVQRVN